MGTPRQEQYPHTYCRKCEAALSKPRLAQQEKYNIVPTWHGAVIRTCTGCYQLWLGYVQQLPNQGIKIILKMVDKEL